MIEIFGFQSQDQIKCPVGSQVYVTGTVLDRVSSDASLERKNRLIAYSRSDDSS